MEAGLEGCRIHLQGDAGFGGLCWGPEMGTESTAELWGICAPSLPSLTPRMQTGDPVHLTVQWTQTFCLAPPCQDPSRNRGHHLLGFGWDVVSGLRRAVQVAIKAPHSWEFNAAQTRAHGLWEEHSSVPTTALHCAQGLQP